MVAVWGGARAQEALQYVRRKGAREQAPCCLCGLPIDYSLRGVGGACSVQHIKPRSLFPELTWDRTNWAPCHADCNSKAGQGSRIDIGPTGW